MRTLIDRLESRQMLADAAAFVSESIASSMTAGQPTAVSVTFKNTGTSTWSEALRIRLGTQAPADNTTWGLQRVLLGSSETVSPGQTKTFSFNVTPPAMPGNYTMQFHMLRENVVWFGDYSQAVSVNVKSSNVPPVGVHDAISSAGWVSGWAFDPSTPNDSMAVHMYVDGNLEAGVLADSPRDDVNAVYGIGGRHGFGWQIPQRYMDGAVHHVQTWGIDTQGGTNVLLSESNKTFANAAPTGFHESISASGWVSGFAFDPSTPNDSMVVHMYVDGNLETGIRAGDARADVDSIYGITGNHGFGWQLPQKYMDGAAHKVQVWGIDTQGGINALLSGSNKTFTNAAPVGVQDSISSTGWVSGWAFDPSQPADSIAVHMYVDGVLQTGVLANSPRPDINPVYGITGNHGFGWQLPDPFLDGLPHVVQAWAIDTQGGRNVLTSGSGTTFNADDEVVYDRRKKVPQPAKGIQAVLLSRYSQASLKNLEAVLTAPGSPSQIEIGFGSNFGSAPGTTPYTNATHLVKSLAAAGKKIWLVTHFAFHAQKYTNGVLGTESGTVTLSSATAAFKTFMDNPDFAGYLSATRGAGQLQLIVSPSLEDDEGGTKNAGYNQRSFELASQYIAGKLGADADYVTFRRSNNHLTKRGITTSMGHKSKPADNFKSPTGKPVQFDYEVHGNVETAYASGKSFAAYSNDGNVVFSDMNIASKTDKQGATKLTKDGVVDEIKGDTFPNADGGDQYGLTDFKNKTSGTGTTAILWRPAYNLYDRKVAAKTNHNFDFAKEDLAKRDDKDADAHFDYYEQRVLAKFLGMSTTTFPAV